MTEDAKSLANSCAENPRLLADTPAWITATHHSSVLRISRVRKSSNFLVLVEE
jgi:hypothetical protein